jgi:putative peptidoglycan lipid II flippase
MRSALTISTAIVVSRILGFARDAVFAFFLGTSLYADAFVVAFRIPNTLRDIAGEGVAGSTFVPVLSRYIRDEKPTKEFFTFSAHLFNVVALVLAALTIGGIVCAPAIVNAIAPGFLLDPVKHAVTITLARIMFVFIFFIGLYACAMSILNALGHFAAPAYAQALFNTFMIAFPLLVHGFFTQKVYVFVWAVLIGGFLQCAMQVPVLWSRGFRFVKGFALSHPAFKEMKSLFIPRAFGASVHQLNLFADTICSSLSRVVGEGVVSAMYYANRIFQLPLAIFGVAFSQALLPYLSRSYLDTKMDEFTGNLAEAIDNIIFWTLPCSVALIMIGLPITRMLFERGMYTSHSSALTYAMLAYYSVGLLPYGMNKVLVTGFYAMHDTKTPLFVGIVALAVNAVFNVALMFPLKAAGIALATSLSALVQLYLLTRYAKKRMRGFTLKVHAASFLKTCACCVPLAAVLESFHLIRSSYAMTKGKEFLLLGASMLFAGAAFFVCAALLRMKQIRFLTRRMGLAWKR